MGSTNSNDFTAIGLKRIIPDKDLICDVYLFINQEYIKYKFKGDSISSDKFNFFLSKNLANIYVLNSDAEAFKEKVKEEKREFIEAKVKDVGEENRETVLKVEAIKDEMYEVFADEKLDRAKVGKLQEQVTGLVQGFSTKNLMANAFLAKLSTQNESMVQHANNVANLSLFLAMVNGQGHALVLEKVYLGSIFHDIYKVKIPAKILESPKSVGYSQAIQDHPKKGADMVREMENIPDGVALIVEQHHEQYNSQGYPGGLGDDKVYNLSKIVALANVIDNKLLENAKKGNEKYKLVFKYLEYDRGKLFDPKLLKRSLEGLAKAW